MKCPRRRHGAPSMNMIGSQCCGCAEGRDEVQVSELLNVAILDAFEDLKSLLLDTMLDTKFSGQKLRRNIGIGMLHQKFGRTSLSLELLNSFLHTSCTIAFMSTSTSLPACMQSALSLSYV